jgi:hypothetical protein
VEADRLRESVMPPGRSDAERRLHAQVAANARWSRSDGRAGTAKMRAAGPGHIDYWIAKVDPDCTLRPAERQRRAEAAKRAYYSRLSLRSAQVRRARKAAEELAAEPPSASLESARARRKAAS